MTRMIGGVSSEALLGVAVKRCGILKINAKKRDEIACSSSVFKWTVHWLRYKLSPSYREQVHEERRQVMDLVVKGDISRDVDDFEDNVFMSRKTFNKNVADEITKNVPQLSKMPKNKNSS